MIKYGKIEEKEGNNSITLTRGRVALTKVKEIGRKNGFSQRFLTSVIRSKKITLLRSTDHRSDLGDDS